MKYIISFLVFIISFSSCSKNDKIDISHIKVNTELVRFDTLFYNIKNKNELDSLKVLYPLMFSSEPEDSVWMNKALSKKEQNIYLKTSKAFGDFKKEYSEIVDVFKYTKYYFPNFSSPKVFTVLSNYDYRYAVLYTGEKLFVSLDMYLGKDEKDYKIFPKYMANNMTRERIKVDVALAISESLVELDKFDRSLLAQMIYNGKILYMSKKLLPDVPDELLIGYSKDQLDWCRINRGFIWEYMIKNKYIYSKDDRLYKRFIDVAPFSKFYLELDNESPGRVGVWLGWQIVNSYMKENNVSLQELMKNEDANEIFRRSKYKPRK